jgi:hypothetical protein
MTLNHQKGRNMPSTQNFRNVRGQRVDTHQGKSTIPDTAVDIENQAAPTDQAGPSQGDVYTETGGRATPGASQSLRESSALASFAPIPSDQKKMLSSEVKGALVIASRALNDGYCLNRPGVSPSTREALMALKKIDLMCAAQITLSTAGMSEKVEGKESWSIQSKHIRALDAFSLESDKFQKRNPDQPVRQARLVRSLELLKDFFSLSDEATPENARTLYPNVIFACRCAGAILFGTCTDIDLSEIGGQGKTGDTVLQEIMVYLDNTLSAIQNVDWSDNASVTALGGALSESGHESRLDESLRILRDLHENTHPSADPGSSSGQLFSSNLHRAVTLTTEKVQDEHKGEINKLRGIINAKKDRFVNLQDSARGIFLGSLAGSAFIWSIEEIFKAMKNDSVHKFWPLGTISAGTVVAANVYGLVDHIFSVKVYFAAANALENDVYPAAAFKRLQDRGTRTKFPTKAQTEELARLGSWRPGHPLSSRDAASRATNTLRKEVREIHQKNNELFRKRVLQSGTLAGALLGTVWTTLMAKEVCQAASLCGLRYVAVAVPAATAVYGAADLISSYFVTSVHESQMCALVEEGYSKVDIVREFEDTKPRPTGNFPISSWFTSNISKMVNGRAPVTATALDGWTIDASLGKTKAS